MKGNIKYMKLKNTPIFFVTIIGFSLLTYISMIITPMPADDRYAEIDPSRIPSAFQRNLTGIIFLSIFLFICIFAFIKKINAVTLGVAVFYSIPFIGILPFGLLESLEGLGLALIWNPYYELIIPTNGFPYIFFILLILFLFFLPLILFTIDVIDSGRKKKTL